MMILVDKLINAVASNNSGRLIEGLCRPEDLLCGAKLLENAQRVAVVTGFYVPTAQAPETDGPPGAAVMARALKSLNKDVQIFTDPLNASAVEACCETLGFEGLYITEDPKALFKDSPDLLVYIERLGAASDGRYYNMRGEDITQWTAPLDKGALMAQDMGVSVLAVGDGGNEVGMGLAKGILQKALPSFEKCLCSVGCTVLIPSDVSNWGAYALVSLLSALKGTWLGHDSQEEKAMIDAMIEAGAVDGKTCLKRPSVDGFPSSVHEEKVEELKELFFEWQEEKLLGCSVD